MKKFLFAAVILLLLVLISLPYGNGNGRMRGQGGKYTLVKKMEGRVDFFTTDNLGNCYLVKGDLLEKYDSNGNLLKTYNNKQYGKIFSLDATNALKVVVFYRDFTAIVLLDNTLSPIGNPIKLEERNFQMCTLVCSSHGNGLWLYNPQTVELIRIDQSLRKTNQPSLISQIPGVEFSPDFLLEQNNHLFLNNPSVGVHQFDIYGNFSKTIYIKGLKGFQVSGDVLLYFLDGKYRSFHTKLLEEEIIHIPSANVFGARSEKERLYLHTNAGMEIYSVK